MADLSQSVTNIPTDVYQWSGLPKQYRDSLLGGIMPNLISSAQNYTSSVNPYMQNTMRQAADTTKGSMQGVLNNLANRNVLNSTVASDAITNLGKELNQQNFGQMNDVALQSKMNEPGVLSNIAQLGQGSENPWQPYQSMLNFLLQI